MCNSQTKDRITQALEAVDLNLNEVLHRFEPDEYMLDQLAQHNIVEQWGERPVTEFITWLIEAGEGVPDIWNGKMDPFNVLKILEIVQTPRS